MMNNILSRVYFGIFYWLFELGENAPSKWLSHWKAYILMTVLEIWTIFSVFYYFSSHYYYKVDLSVKEVSIPFLIAFLTKIYFLFEKDDKWQDYIYYFRSLSKNERKKSLIITGLALFLCVLNIALSIYYLSENK